MSRGVHECEKCSHLKFVKLVLIKNKFRKIKSEQHVSVALQIAAIFMS